MNNRGYWKLPNHLRGKSSNSPSVLSVRKSRHFQIFLTHSKEKSTRGIEGYRGACLWGKGWSDVNEINSFTDSRGIFSSGNTRHFQLPHLRWTKTTETVRAWRAFWRIINLACKTKAGGREGGTSGLLPSLVPKQLLWEWKWSFLRPKWMTAGRLW